MVGGEEYYLSADEALKFKMIDAIAAPRTTVPLRKDARGVVNDPG
jgi:hypothetical protein